jgi:EmrB/QacA subfamily drug resistance transporter
MTHAPAAQCDDPVHLGTARGKGVLFATVLGSGISFLDGLVLNVALPKMDNELHLGVVGLQWVVSGFLVTIGAFLLLGGSLGDQFGRRRIYLTGLSIFLISSMACGLAPDSAVVIAARAVQGFGGALMVPASLAIIQAVFVPEDRGAAIGAWTGLSAVFTALGPFVGGVFVTYISWRWAFFINVPLGVIAWWATMRYVPESKDSNAHHRPDVVGAVLAAVGLAAVSFWSIEASGSPYGEAPLIVGVTGLFVLAGFVLFESRITKPMLPLVLFKSAQFNWVNICTIIFYGSFVAGITFMGVQLQTNLGYSPLEASLATFPTSVLMFVLSKRFGAWGNAAGAKYPMTLGPALVAVALFLMADVQAGRHYWTGVLPAVLIWGLGLSITVAPLTAAALAAIDQRFIGVGSAVNNAASRIGSSLAISLLPAVVGIAGDKSLSGSAFASGFRHLMYVSSGLCLFAALIALVFVAKNGESRSTMTQSPFGYSEASKSVSPGE